MNRKPIDKTKRSNRRCVNCIHYKNRQEVPVRSYWDKSLFCPESGERIEYWNVCKKFEWNPEKEYLTQETKEEN